MEFPENISLCVYLYVQVFLYVMHEEASNPFLVSSIIIVYIIFELGLLTEPGTHQLTSLADQ